MKFAKFSLAFGVISQASVSIANFIIGFILVRALDSVGFGEYGIGFALALLCAAASNALLVTPAAVLAGEYECQERRIFQFSLISACLALSVVLTFSAIAIFAVGKQIVNMGTASESVSSGLVCGAGLLIREVFVQMAFIETKAHLAAKINSIYMVTMLIAIGLLGYTDSISAPVALLANALICICCGLLGAILMRRYWFAPTSRILGHWKTLFTHGKWSLGGVVVGWIHQQGYVYIVAALAGVSAVGQLNAARLIISPLLFLQTGMQNVIVPRVAKLWVSDKLDGYQTARKLSYGLFLLTLAYSVFCYAFTESWINLLIGSSSEQLALLMFFWLAWALVVTLRSNNALLLQCSRQFSYLAGRILIATLVSLAICYFWVSSFGVSGAVPSLVIGEIALVLLTQLKIGQLWREG